MVRAVRHGAPAPRRRARTPTSSSSRTWSRPAAASPTSALLRALVERQAQRGRRDRAGCGVDGRAQGQRGDDGGARAPRSASAICSRSSSTRRSPRAPRSSPRMRPMSCTGTEPGWPASDLRAGTSTRARASSSRPAGSRARASFSSSSCPARPRHAVRRGRQHRRRTSDGLDAGRRPRRHRSRLRHLRAACRHDRRRARAADRELPRRDPRERSRRALRGRVGVVQGPRLRRARASRGAWPIRSSTRWCGPVRSRACRCPTWSGSRSSGIW